MRVGDKVARTPETFTVRDGERNSAPRTLRGRVVYIHPLGRYHVVEFETPGGKIRECFGGAS